MTSADISRIEVKVDGLTESINKLIIFEERQAVHALALSALAARTSTVEQKLDMWVNRGIGVWALAVSLFGIYKTLGH